MVELYTVRHREGCAQLWKLVVGCDDGEITQHDEWV